jgi:hypothetical protein
MAAGLTNTLRQVGTATGVAVLGAVYAARVSAASLHELAGVAAPPAALHRLADAVASGAGTRVIAAVPPEIRDAVGKAARAGTASGLNHVLLAAAAFAALGAVVGFAYGPDAKQPPATSPTNGATQGAPAQQHTQPIGQTRLTGRATTSEKPGGPTARPTSKVGARGGTTTRSLSLGTDA